LNRKAGLALAVIPLLLVVGFLPMPASAGGPRFQELLIKYYGSVGAVWDALKAGEIDIMNWPITYAQYQEAITDPNIIVAPYNEFGMYEIDFNSNYTSLYDPGAGRNPLNYTKFRQALAFCVDKEWLMRDIVKGFGTRIDTPVSRPLHNTPWVNFDYCKWGPNGEDLGNYPYEYDPAMAAQLLDEAGFVQGTTPNPNYDASKPWSARYIRTYPQGHERAGEDLRPLKVYIRSDHEPRKQAGEALVDHMKKLGIPVDVTEGPSSVCAPPVMAEWKFHIYTGGWSMGRFPLHFYALYTPIGIFEWGPNCDLIQDSELTYWAELEYPKAPDLETAIRAAHECQRILVEKCYGVWLYTAGGYIAYRKGLLGMLNTRGYGFSTNIDLALLNVYHEDPNKKQVIWGLNQPPRGVLNPLFAQWLYEYEVIDRIFSGFGMLTFNPYDPVKPGKSPSASDMPWYAVDWKVTVDDEGLDHVHIWIRPDIKWHDGQPFTVRDINYTIYLILSYEDAWAYPDLYGMINRTIIHNDYYIEVVMTGHSYWNVYVPGVVPLPEHIYSQIQDHHGKWPGKGEGFTPEQVFVGIGEWKFKDHARDPLTGDLTLAPGAWCLLEKFNDFWMELGYSTGNVYKCDVDFLYFFNAGNPPQGGSYKIGLPDLVKVALAYGSSATGVPSANWEPGCDIAAPSGAVGLADLVQVALAYGQTWGTYTPPP